jgi:hypothetical protein
LRVSPATVIAGLALVFAMTGGAYAAKKYLITSTKQISPSVLKSLQGKVGAGGVNGAQGAAGAVGPQGPAGSQGAKGETGAAGKDGVAGKDGTNGKDGKEGKAGPEGSPWTAGGTLPEGATETGAFGVKAGESGLVFSSVSFAVPLAGALNEEHVLSLVEGYNGEDEVSTEHKECPGTAANPRAKSGFLCVYVGAQEGVLGEKPLIQQPNTVKIEENIGADRSGAALVFFTPGGMSAVGTWAVTG